MRGKGVGTLETTAFRQPRHNYQGGRPPIVLLRVWVGVHPQSTDGEGAGVLRTCVTAMDARTSASMLSSSRSITSIFSRMHCSAACGCG